MKTRLALSLGTLALLGGSAVPVRGEDPTPASTREAINAKYRTELARLERERIEALTRLAASQQGREAEQTYLEIFELAIASDDYRNAEPAAQRLLQAADAATAAGEAEGLARLVWILAEADRGDF